MVRGLFLIPADSPSSPGGEGWRSDEQRNEQSCSFSASSNRSSEEGMDEMEERPKSQKSVADIIAACEALEKRTREMRELAAKNPGEESMKKNRFTIGDDGGETSVNGPVYMTDELIDKAAEMISNAGIPGDELDTSRQTRIPRDDLAAIPPSDTAGEVDQIEEVEEKDRAISEIPDDVYNEPHVSMELLTVYDLPATDEKSEEEGAKAEEVVQEEVTSFENEKTLPDRQESIMSEKRELGGNLRIEFSPDEQRAKLKVIGVGGAGSNAVDNMISSQLAGVDFIAVNTDAQALFDEHCLAPTKMQIGKEYTRGLGAGGDPEAGRFSAEEDMDRLRDMFNGADMVFVASGMGGGTGSGAAPVIAQLARDRGILTIGIVTKPFGFEGKKRMKRAEIAVAEMKEAVDTLIVIPNDKVFDLFKDDLPYHEAFKQVDQVLYQGTKGISDLINRRGFINVDFADVKTVMSNSGDAIMGIGVAEGENRAAAAAESAIDSPLLDNLRIDGASGILINISGGKNVGMKEVQQAVQVVTESALDDADVYFGLVEDESLGDQISVTVIATGFNSPPTSTASSFRSRKVEPTPQFHAAESSRSLKSIEEHRQHANGKNGKNGTNGTNGTNGKSENGSQDPKEFVRVDADPMFVNETLADRDKLEDVPAFLRRGFRNGKRDK